MYIRNKNDKISYNIRYQVTGYQYFFLNKDSSPLNRKSLEHELTKDVFYNIQNLITEIDNKFIIKKIK
jgi:predicted SprT family Zn-dependent metalloprotease